ncbi:MAG: hypothetical protein WAV02_12525 [Stellaceae bacterium]
MRPGDDALDTSAAVRYRMVDRVPPRLGATRGRRPTATLIGYPAMDQAAARRRHRNVLPAARCGGDSGGPRCSIGLIHIERAASRLRGWPLQRPGFVAEVVRHRSGRIEISRAGAGIRGPRAVRDKSRRETKQQGYSAAARMAEHRSLYRMTHKKGRKNECHLARRRIRSTFDTGRKLTRTREQT